MKKISLYIPTRNSGDYLRECLDSVFSQDMKFSEVIIVDEDSTDDTLDAAAGYDVRIIKIKRGAGLAHARNAGIKNSRYGIVASIDSDVVLERDWLKNITRNFDDKGYTGAGGRLIEKNKDYCSRWRSTHMRQDWGLHRRDNPRFLFGSNCAFKKKDILDIGGYDEKYKTNYEDVDMSDRLKSKGYKLVYEPDAVCYHRKRDNILSLMKSYYGWTFYGYPVPDSFQRLLQRTVIFNPHKSFKLLLKDLAGINVINLPADILAGILHSVYDLKYYLRKPMER